MSVVAGAGRKAFAFAFWFWLVSIPLNIALAAFGYSPIGPSNYQSASQQFIQAAQKLNQTGGYIGGFSNPFFGMDVTTIIINAVLSLIAGIALLFVSAASAIGNPIIVAIAGTVGTVLQALVWIYVWNMVVRGQPP